MFPKPNYETSLMKEVREENIANKDKCIRIEAQIDKEPGCDPTCEEIAERILEPERDLREIMLRGWGLQLDQKGKDELKEVLERAIAEDVPLYKQPFVFRLIKMHQADYQVGKTETFHWLNKYLSAKNKSKVSDLF